MSDDFQALPGADESRVSPMTKYLTGGSFITPLSMPFIQKSNQRIGSPIAMLPPSAGYFKSPDSGPCPNAASIRRCELRTDGAPCSCRKVYPSRMPFSKMSYHPPTL